MDIQNLRHNNLSGDQTKSLYNHDNVNATIEFLIMHKDYHINGTQEYKSAIFNDFHELISICRSEQHTQIFEILSHRLLQTHDTIMTDFKADPTDSTLKHLQSIDLTDTARILSNTLFLAQIMLTSQCDHYEHELKHQFMNSQSHLLSNLKEIPAIFGSKLQNQICKLLEIIEELKLKEFFLVGETELNDKINLSESTKNTFSQQKMSFQESASAWFPKNKKKDIINTKNNEEDMGTTDDEQEIQKNAEKSAFVGRIMGRKYNSLNSLECDDTIPNRIHEKMMIPRVLASTVSTVKGWLANRISDSTAPNNDSKSPPHNDNTNETNETNFSSSTTISSFLSISKLKNSLPKFGKRTKICVAVQTRKASSTYKERPESFEQQASEALLLYD